MPQRSPYTNNLKSFRSNVQTQVGMFEANQSLHEITADGHSLHTHDAQFVLHLQHASFLYHLCMASVWRSGQTMYITGICARVYARSSDYKRDR